jgi:hypothetical protein
MAHTTRETPLAGKVALDTGGSRGIGAALTPQVHPAVKRRKIDVSNPH